MPLIPTPRRGVSGKTMLHSETLTQKKKGMDEQTDRWTQRESQQHPLLVSVGICTQVHITTHTDKTKT